MPVAAVGKAVVDLVAVDEQVVALGDAGELVLHVVVEDGAGRVGGVAQEQRLRLRRDRGLDSRGIQREVVIEARRHVHDGPAREHDRRHVCDVAGLVEDDLVAGIAGRAEGQVHGLRRADRDQDLARRVVADAVEPLQVIRQGPPQLDGPVVRGVVGAALAQALDAGLDDVAGRVEVGLADTEADDVVHRCRDVEEAPDTGRRDGMDPLRQGTLGKRGASGGGVVRHG